MKSLKNKLLIIDPQNDFCEATSSKNKPALPVPGSLKDMKNIIKFIQENELEEIIVTLDTHSIIDIAHPLWWIKNDGSPVEPFTVITKESIEKGLYKTRNELDMKYSTDYINKLEENAKYQLIVWPEHCIQGTWGHNVFEELQEELKKWTHKTNKNVTYFYKGTNIRTEHYSAMKAEVVLDEDTDLNHKLLSKLKSSSTLYVCGEALSHCVSSTVKDIIENTENDFHNKIVMLENASSSVSGFEKEGQKFIDFIKTKGVSVLKI